LEETGDKTKVSRTLNYEAADSAVVFRLAWYAVASAPGVLLNEYSEAESQIFEGRAQFSGKTENQRFNVSISVEEAQKSVIITAWGDEESSIADYAGDVETCLKSSIEKYTKLADEDKSKLRRALVAKTCWDRLVYEILNKAPLSAVYIQLAHGREMMIKATEGEDIHPLTLSTSGWLSRIESLPREEAPPASIASELAKKSIEWKKSTHEVISRYL